MGYNIAMWHATLSKMVSSTIFVRATYGMCIIDACVQTNEIFIYVLFMFNWLFLIDEMIFKWRLISYRRQPLSYTRGKTNSLILCACFRNFRNKIPPQLSRVSEHFFLPPTVPWFIQIAYLGITLTVTGVLNKTIKLTCIDIFGTVNGTV